jgi:ABC-type dipeptide/oligopeptide/nickel transport system permease component
MTRYIAFRLLQAVGVLWAAYTVSFLVLYALPGDPASLLAAVAELETEGVRRKEAIVEIARRAGVPKREVYNLVHGGEGQS